MSATSLTFWFIILNCITFWFIILNCVMQARPPRAFPSFEIHASEGSVLIILMLQSG